MIVISHRGNIEGVNLDLENNPKHVQELLDKGISVEIDVWFTDNLFYLGHDEPLHATTERFLKQDNLWCHAKNLNALTKLLTLGAVCFWHQEDNYTLTSNNYIWTYPGIPVKNNCIIVDLTPDWKNKMYNCAGICTDYINL